MSHDPEEMILICGFGAQIIIGVQLIIIVLLIIIIIDVDNSIFSTWTTIPFLWFFDEYKVQQTAFIWNCDIL